jgi:hypothetical protein
MSLQDDKKLVKSALKRLGDEVAQKAFWRICDQMQSPCKNDHGCFLKKEPRRIGHYGTSTKKIKLNLGKPEKTLTLTELCRLLEEEK